MTDKPLESLSAKFSDSFAYATIKDRLPVILTKIIDSIHRTRNEIGEKYGCEAKEQVKDVVGRLSKLRNELQTNKPLTPITDDGRDAEIWNEYLQSRIDSLQQAPTWFEDSWLYVECYMYRRIHEAFQLSDHIRENIKPFRQQKEDSFNNCQQAIMVLLDFLMKTTSTLEYGAENDENNETEKLFNEFLKVSLWGNKCDLSISALGDNVQNVDPLSQIEMLQSKILIDNSQQVLEYLKRINSEERGPTGVRVDIVLDNAGFELVTDLCFAEFLLSSKLADSVYFHGKALPWFVSDVVASDFFWTLNTLKSSEHASLSHFGNKWAKRIKNNSWMYVEHEFWTTPFDFSHMEMISPALHAELALSDFIFLKGDLNYRKLCGDLNWSHTTPYEVALRGFHPAPHCSLRTLKADIIVGLADGKDKEIESNDPDWMTTGKYAVVQWCNNRV
ncbi:damage-control phosphatase ARMT1-like [Tubulanus polymorphus]|uniref:damage-control phosphatase ARMT1-like n=1 Tax=Tubulanus polymorphus TaxID=672921 RepID=UPI003DA54F59